MGRGRRWRPQDRRQRREGRWPRARSTTSSASRSMSASTACGPVAATITSSIRIVPVERLLFTPPIDLPIPAIAQEWSIAAGEGGIWVVSTDHRLVRVDPDHEPRRPVSRRRSPRAPPRRVPGSGRSGSRCPRSDTLLRIPPADPTTSQAIKVGDGPRFLAIGDDAVWVMNQGDGTVTRVDRRTARSSPRSRFGRLDPGRRHRRRRRGASGCASSRTSSCGSIPATNAVIARFGPPSGQRQRRGDDDALWVTAHDVVVGLADAASR